MARPRVFVSSTYYDLKHLRSSLDNFIESLGFDSILSEKGDIAYLPDSPLDESCYREVEHADIFVLIIGGRYGSEASRDRRTEPKEGFYETYESITKLEYQRAAELGIPIYVLIEAPLFAEYKTFQKNKGNDKIVYAHADSVNVFRLIEDILAKHRNNPMQTFERFTDIQGWLQEQWAGLFRTLLHDRSTTQQIASLSTQVNAMAELNTTLKRYLEELMKKQLPDESESLIHDETERRDAAARLELLENNPLIGFLMSCTSHSVDDIGTAIKKATSFREFTDILGKGHKNLRRDLLRTLKNSSRARQDYNEARKIFGLDPFNIENELDDLSSER